MILGKSIGEGASRDRVYDLSWCLLIVSFLLGLILAGLLAVALPTLFIPYLYPLFSLSPLATRAAVMLCVVYLILRPSSPLISPTSPACSGPAAMCGWPRSST